MDLEHVCLVKIFFGRQRKTTPASIGQRENEELGSGKGFEAVEQQQQRQQRQEQQQRRRVLKRGIGEELRRSVLHAEAGNVRRLGRHAGVGQLGRAEEQVALLSRRGE